MLKATMGMSLADRLSYYSMPIPWTGCWEWIGALAKSGYGVLNVGGKTRLAHRLSYESFAKAIPAGLSLDHLCKNVSCVNPAHLEPVSIGENSRRSKAFLIGAALQRKKAHCPQGHEYSGKNLRINQAGSRECRACSSARVRKWRASKCHV